MHPDSSPLDLLTGVASRESLPPTLDASLIQAREQGEALALLVIDLDYFKSVNDAFGHVRGDRVLADLARRMQSQLRGADTLFRYGGDEFVILAPGTGREAALTLARRLLHSVASAPFPGEPPLALSISLGVATFPEDGATPETLFERADRGLLRAKRLGRGQAAAATEAPEPEPRFDRSGRLIERDDELGTVHWFLSDLPVKRRGVLLVEGPEGAGKSRFLEEIYTLAMLRGHQVLALRPSAELRSRPLGSLLAACTGWPGFPTLSPAARTNPERFAAVLHRYLAQRPAGLLLLVDDVHELDPASLHLLASLTAAHLPQQLGLVLAAVPGFWNDIPPPPAPLRDRIQLLPLSREGLRACVRGTLHLEAPDALLDWLITRSRGVPGLVLETLAELVSTRRLRQEDHGWIFTPGGRLASDPEPRSPAPESGLSGVAAGEFVGRERELYHLKHLIERARLLTLTGPGGVGKTRLSRQLLHEVQDRFEAGALEVSLVSLTHAGEVGPALARALGVPERAGLPLLEALAERLRDRRMLVMLDNFEHLLPAAALLTDLLAACPDLHFLVTSRARLGVFGEALFPLEPLPVPDPRQMPPVAVLAEYPGVALFLDCARRAAPDFRLDAASAPAVAAVCSRLEGLPLALELAAARLATGSLADLEASLVSSLDLAADPGSAGHHTSVRAAIAWSVALLTAPERRLFAALSVFRGGWTLESATGLVAEQASSGGAAEVAADRSLIARHLRRLADQHLIRRDPEGRRYTMLETVREFALELLRSDPAAEAVRDAHARYFLDLVERTEPYLTGGRQPEALDTLESEHPNLRAALSRWLEQHDSEAAQRMAGALWRFWTTRGYLTEAATWLARALDETPREPTSSTPVRARALLAAGILAQFRGRFDDAQTFLEAARAIYEHHKHPAGLAAVLNNLGNVAQLVGDDARGYAFWNQSLVLRRELNDRPGMAATLHNLAEQQHRAGRREEAIRMYEESLALCRELGDYLNAGNNLHDLATLARVQGHSMRARELLEECLRVWSELGYVPGTIVVLDALGDVAMEAGQPTRAVVLWGAGEAAREALGQPPDNLRIIHCQRVSEARQQLEASRFQSLWQEGRALSLEDALGLARSPEGNPNTRR